MTDTDDMPAEELLHGLQPEMPVAVLEELAELPFALSAQVSEVASRGPVQESLF
jgi:hypothetical protein